jgi:hypothetical protein
MPAILPRTLRISFALLRNNPDSAHFVAQCAKDTKTLTVAGPRPGRLSITEAI